MKKIIASMLVVASMFTSTAFALDMPDTVTGYIGGYIDNTVRPDYVITRAEMAQVIQNIMQFKPGSAKFDDVSSYDWYNDVVNTVGDHKLFTPVTHPQAWNISAAKYPRVGMMLKVYDTLKMDNVGMGPYEVIDNLMLQTAPADVKDKLRKVWSWGFDSYISDSSFSDFPEYWEENYMKITLDFPAYGEENYMPGDLAKGYMNDMIIEIYPNGIEVSELGSAVITPEDPLNAHWKVGTIFQPQRRMTREEMALVLYRMNPAQSSSAATYSDISNLKQESKDAIGYLSSKGVITGYSDGTFRPFYPVTRAEAIVMINRFFGDKVVASNSSFNPKDLAGHWAEDEIRKILKDTEVDNTLVPPPSGDLEGAWSW